jgi:hypothetical protein
MQELSSDSMALNRNSSDEPTKSKYAPPLDSDSHEDYNPSSPSSSPPPVIRNTSFKLFAASHAQRRAITEKSSTAALTNTAKPVNADKSTRIPSSNTYVTAKDAPRDKVAGLTDLRSLIDDAKQKALACNEPEKSNQVEQLYRQSLSDKRLTALLEAVLHPDATRQQHRELKKYIKDKKREIEKLADEEAAKLAEFNRSLDYRSQRALDTNNPRKTEQTQQLYEWSRSDDRLRGLLKAVLASTATPEQARELHRYVDKTKVVVTGTSLDTMPNKIAKAEPSTARTAIEPQAHNKMPEASRRARPRFKSQADNKISEASTIQTAEPLFKPQADNKIAEAIAVALPAKPITRDQLLDFCTLQLWPRYCRLPPGRNTTAAFEALTSIQINDRGQILPSHPVPDPWLQEVGTQLSRLLQVARPDKRAWIEHAIPSPGFQGQDVHVLFAEELRWSMHHGPLKRREIGLLLECVGIERKGSSWKG